MNHKQEKVAGRPVEYREPAHASESDPLEAKLESMGVAPTAPPDTKHDVIDAMQELLNTMPLPGRVVDAMSDAVIELKHLRWQRDSLQKRGSELVKERQAAQTSVDRKLKDLAAEELHKEIRWLTERALMAERVAFKLSEYFDQYDSPGEFLTEPECYVLEGIDYRQGLLGPADDPSCKEPTCTRKHEPHTKECGCVWDHVTNDWSKRLCTEHAPPKGPAVLGGKRGNRRSWAEMVVVAVTDELVRQGVTVRETDGEGLDASDFVSMIKELASRAPR